MRLAVLFLLSACSPAPQAAADEPPRVVEPRPSGALVLRGPDRLRAAMLAGHNAARARLGLEPLRWSDALAADADGYARVLAQSGRFEHSPLPRGTPTQGENLWTGTRGAYSYREMVGHWVAERRFYVALPVPSSSNSGRFGDVGHYTQIVWRGTQEVGCAEASSPSDDYVVCRYLPAGNVAGQTAY
ncbi:MAG TPA: CAP domain-containing protein [Allosphingosinicella sp.]|jgi:hypothetical protein|nr:CAP domain-containing protein [Allosphingosinicella sp.]